MTHAKLSLNTDTIHYQVRSAVADLGLGVENIRLIATALGGPRWRAAHCGWP